MGPNELGLMPNELGPIQIEVGPYILVAILILFVVPTLTPTLISASQLILLPTPSSPNTTILCCLSSAADKQQLNS